MGRKLSEHGFEAGRKDVDTILPTDLSLVWHEKTAEFGPRDFLIKDMPDLHWAFDPSIAEPLNEEHVELALTKKENGCYIGILEPIGYRKVEIKGKLHLVVVFGRGRTRMAREANRRILKAGGSKSDFIFVPSQLRDIDDTVAALERDIENLHRKPVTPLMIARVARYHISKGTPEHLILKACKVTTMAAVRNYTKLLEAPPAVQRMVDSGDLPLAEGLRVKAEEVPAVEAAVAEKGALTAREAQEARGITPAPKMMTRGEIEGWIESLINRGPQARLVESVLKTVLGTGEMTEHKFLAPPKKKK